MNIHSVPKRQMFQCSEWYLNGTVGLGKEKRIGSDSYEVSQLSKFTFKGGGIHTRDHEMLLESAVTVKD